MVAYCIAPMFPGSVADSSKGAGLTLTVFTDREAEAISVSFSFKIFCSLSFGIKPRASKMPMMTMVMTITIAKFDFPDDLYCLSLHLNFSGCSVCFCVFLAISRQPAVNQWNQNQS